VNNSVIILAGGSSTRFGQDKGLLQLAGKPLIKHVLDKTRDMADETIVVASSKTQAEKYAKPLGNKAKVIIDADIPEGPLRGAVAGFNWAHGEYSLLLPCDTPFVSSQILQLLLDLCINKNAAVPRWPNGFIEPLQAAYHTKTALKAAEDALEVGRSGLKGMVETLKNVRYVSTIVLKQFDPELRTFFNVNTPLDIRKADFALGGSKRGKTDASNRQRQHYQ
jgi:molybdopterin-guanine dinucleotide biosynthesis protein A